MVTDHIDSVAVIGTGAMGEQMVGHLVDDGYDVYAFDVAESALSAAVERGAEPADSAGKAAANADMSLIVVGTYEQVESTLFNDDGIVPHTDEGHIVAISSTLAPEECTALATVAQEEGAIVLDVPTCRGEQAAEDGELLVLCGGPAGAFSDVKPVLGQFAATDGVVRFGELGTGQVAKTANNTLLWAALVINYEVLSLAQEYDLDLNQLRAVLERSSGDNWALREWDWIYSKWAHKDMAITMDMAAQKRQTMPLAGLTRQLVQDIDETDLNGLR